MKDYYDLMNLEKNASPADVKKAYFRLVRQFPPDRFPNDFMKIREAYEVLSNEHSRKQYDDIHNLPEMIGYLYKQAREALDQAKTDQAINLLEQVNQYYPEYNLVKSLLGDAYYANGNSGKAYKIFEELATSAPDNAGYLGKLANSCLKRGWHKKAVDIFRCALDLDEDNLSLWMGLIDCYMKSHEYAAAHQVAHAALETSKRKKWDPLELYYYIIQIDIIMMDDQGMKEHVVEMQRAALNNDDQKPQVSWFLAHLGRFLQQKGYQEKYAFMMKAAFDLTPDDEEIRKIRDEIVREDNLRSQIASLRARADIDEIWPDLFEFELERCDDLSCGNCQVRQLSLEMSIIMAAESLRKQLIQIRREYPDLFQLKSEFLINVSNLKRYDGLLVAYQKKYIALQQEFPEEFQDDQENGLNDEGYRSEPYKMQQQAIRNENKVGRNDPCPCGSGKKYKKCCGK